MFKLKPYFLGLSILISTFSFAGSELSSVPEELQYCTVCHGTQFGGSSGTNAPRLSHLPSWYVEKQLISFKNAWRGAHEKDEFGNEMRVGAEGIDLSMVKKAAVFVASTSSPVPESTLEGDLKHGQQLYMTCAVCHGQKGEGNQPMSAPPLAGSNSWYLVRQLENFKHGYRGNNTNDIQGSIMKSSAAVLADEQAIVDVVTYIQSLTQK